MALANFLNDCDRYSNFEQDSRRSGQIAAHWSPVPLACSRLRVNTPQNVACARM
ncbi:TPA: hypothetical protein VAK94_004499 [Citrobacter freundii]|nr:hypothetical protein [Citrobacter freundii]